MTASDIITSHHHPGTTTTTTTTTATTSTKWYIGQFVHVSSLTSPGLNREGGHGKIVGLHHAAATHPGEEMIVTGLDIKYTLWTSTDRNVDPSIVSPYQSLERGHRSRRGRDLLTVPLPGAGSTATSTCRRTDPPKKKPRRSTSITRTTAADSIPVSDDDEQEERVEAVAAVQTKKKKEALKTKEAKTPSNENVSSDGNGLGTSALPAQRSDAGAKRGGGNPTVAAVATAPQRQQSVKAAVAKPRAKITANKKPKSNNNPVVAIAPGKKAEATKKRTAPLANARAAKNPITTGANKMKPGNATVGACAAVLPAGMPLVVIAKNDDSEISPLAIPKNLMMMARKGKARRQLHNSPETSNVVKASNNLDCKPAAAAAVNAAEPQADECKRVDDEEEEANSSSVVVACVEDDNEEEAEEDPHQNTLAIPTVANACDNKASPEAAVKMEVTTAETTPVISDTRSSFIISSIADLMRTDGQVNEHVILAFLNQPSNRIHHVDDGEQTSSSKSKTTFTGEEVEICLEKLCREERIMRSEGVIYSLL